MSGQVAVVSTNDEVQVLTIEELYTEFKALKIQSQADYEKVKSSTDEPISKLNQDIQAVFTSKRKQKLSKIYEAFYEAGLVDRKIRDLEQKILNLNKTPGKVRKQFFYWVTINPPPECHIRELHIATEKLASRSFIEDYVYVIEQRGETEEEAGKGIHIHLLFKIKDDPYEPPSKIKKYLKSTYKQIVNVETKALWIQPCPKEYVKDKIDYILDTNKDSTKTQKQNIDKYYREQNRIAPYYTNIDDIKTYERN